MTLAAKPRKWYALKCQHAGVHGPDSERGAVQRCYEATVMIRAENSPEGTALRDAMSSLDAAIGPYTLRIIREMYRLDQQEGTLVNPDLDPEEEYGRTQEWDPEGEEG